MTLKTFLCILTSVSLLCITQTHAQENTIEDSIRTHRMGTLTIKTTPGAVVKVNQLQHEFWFGTAISRHAFSDRAPQQVKEKYLQLLKENFNSAVHENALKWKSIERKKDNIIYHDADLMYQWCHDNDIKMRGHCVYWAVGRRVQNWIKKLDNKSLRLKLESRTTDLLTHFKGRISEFDVNNEMIHGYYYASRLGDDIRTQMFHWCKEANPDAILYVNDYAIMTRGYLDRYEKHIEQLLEAGAPLGGIGIQSHFKCPEDDPIDVKYVKHVLDRLARFNLPIKITEYDINTDDEEMKAQGLVDFYTTCFAHPAVNGILMWGFWEGRHWRPKAALWNKDWSPTKAAIAYRDLVYDKWWTSYEGKADAQGLCKVDVFYGKHTVSVSGQQLIIEITKEQGSKEIHISAQ